MAFLDTIKRILGLDAAPPTPPAPPVPPSPRSAADARGPDLGRPPRPDTSGPAQPVAVITLRKGEASLSTPGRPDRVADAPYRRPTSVPNGTYTAARQGGGIALTQDGRRITTVYPSDQAGSNDLGLQFLMWQMLLDSVGNDAAATVRIDDLHPGDERTESEPDLTPDTDVGDLDLSSPTQGEQDAMRALGALGYETPPRPILDKQETAPATPAPAESPTPAPAPAPTAPDTWTPSGAYER